MWNEGPGRHWLADLETNSRQLLIAGYSGYWEKTRNINLGPIREAESD